MRKNVEARVLGPYVEKDRWRLVILEKGVRRSEYLASALAAQRRKVQLTKKQLELQEFTVGSLIAAYIAEKESLGVVLAETCRDQAKRLNYFLGSVVSFPVPNVTPKLAERLYSDLTKRLKRSNGKPIAVATHRLLLKYAKHLFGWAARKGFLSDSPFKSVTPIGKPKVGKPQLRIDEARRFIDTALADYELRGKPIALAVVMALTMGLRASELLNRQIRDLDDDCGILWIDRGKTANARRHLRIPEFIRPYLQRQVHGQDPAAHLFASEVPGISQKRQIMLATVRRFCKQANVASVCTHSLRGLYATLAVESGALAETVATSLGHSSFAVTEKHYAQPSVVSNAKTARVGSLLTSSKKPPAAATDLESVAHILTTLAPEQRAELLLLLYKKDENVPPAASSHPSATLP